MATRAFHHEEFSLPPRGSRVRTVTTRGGHRVRLAFPPGPRRRGAGRLVSVLHPKGERNPRPWDQALRYIEALRSYDPKLQRYAESLWAHFQSGSRGNAPLRPYGYSAGKAKLAREAAVERSLEEYFSLGPDLGKHFNPGFPGDRPSGDPFVASIHHGDRVTIVDRFGQQRTGRAVMHSGAGRGWVLNMGGAHGTPGLAYPENTVRIRHAGGRGDSPAGQLIRGLRNPPLERMRELAWAAAIDTANRSMLKAGRKAWTKRDYETAVREFNRLWPAEKDAPGFSQRLAGRVSESNPAGVLTGLELAREFGIEPGKLFGVKGRRKNASETFRDDQGRQWIGSVYGSGTRFVADAWMREGRHAARHVTATGSTEADAWDKLVTKISPNPRPDPHIGLHVEYSPVNQAYFVMWFDQVLRVVTSKAEAKEIVYDLTHRANPRYSGDPRWLEAKYGGTCKKCGRQVRPGERIFYYPRGKRVYCEGEQCGQAAAADFASHAFDEDVLSNPRKVLTREQVEKKQAKAVAFLRDVVKDDDKADEIEGLSLEEYAAKKKIALGNPRKPFGFVGAKSTHEKAQSLGYRYVAGAGRESTTHPGVYLNRFTKDLAQQGPAVLVGWDRQNREWVIEYENPRAKGRKLSVPEKHQLRVAEGSLRMPDAMLGVIGGPSKAEAREIIFRLTGRRPKENPVVFVAGTKAEAEAHARSVRAYGDKTAKTRPCWVDDETGVVIFRKGDVAHPSMKQWCVQTAKENPLHLPDAWAQASPRMRSQLLRAAGTPGPFSLLAWHRLPVKVQKAIAHAAASRSHGAFVPATVAGLTARSGNPYTADDPRIQRLLGAWHESQRTDFERMYPHVDYDEAQSKFAKDRAKYIALDEGRFDSQHRSGRFLIDKQTGMVYNIKAYGVPNKRQPVGTVEQMTAFYEQRRPYAGGGHRLRLNPIHLQGIGKVTSIPVSEAKPGMKILYNYGAAYEIVSITPTSGRSVRLTVRSPEGKEYSQTKRLDTQIAAYWPRGRTLGNPNGSPAAAGLYETFHGRPPQEVLEFPAPASHGGNYAALGDLSELETDLPNGLRLELHFTKADGILLASNAVSGSEGTQLYVVGGNQDISGLLEDRHGIDRTKEKLNLGRVRLVTYQAQKAFDSYVTTDYVHKFGEGKKEKPVLLFDQRTKALEFAGGEYEIKAPGIMG